LGLGLPQSISSSSKVPNRLYRLTGSLDPLGHLLPVVLLAGPGLTNLPLEGGWSGCVGLVPPDAPFVDGSAVSVCEWQLEAAFCGTILVTAIGTTK
jgi:hypothetical protein